MLVYAVIEVLVPVPVRAQALKICTRIGSTVRGGLAAIFGSIVQHVIEAILLLHFSIRYSFSRVTGEGLTPHFGVDDG